MNDLLKEMAAMMYDYEPVVVSDSINEVIKRSLVETIFNVVVKNTAEKTNITKNILSYLREELEKFENATKISIEEYIADGGDLLNRKEYEYSAFMSKYDIKGWIEITLAIIAEFNQNNIWYEDCLANGFCCRCGNRHFHITYN